MIKSGRGNQEVHAISRKREQKREKETVRY